MTAQLLVVDGGICLSGSLFLSGSLVVDALLEFPQQGGRHGNTGRANDAVLTAEESAVTDFEPAAGIFQDAPVEGAVDEHVAIQLDDVVEEHPLPELHNDSSLPQAVPTESALNPSPEGMHS